MFEFALIGSWFLFGFLLRKILGLDNEFDILQKGHKGLLFCENYVSAKRTSAFWISGSAWASIVLVTKSDLWVWPMLGFRPLFIAKLYGLEQRFQVEKVKVLKVQEASFCRKAITLSAMTAQGRTINFTIYLKNPAAFLNLFRKDE